MKKLKLFKRSTFCVICSRNDHIFRFTGIRKKDLNNEINDLSLRGYKIKKVLEERK